MLMLRQYGLFYHSLKRRKAMFPALLSLPHLLPGRSRTGQSAPLHAPRALSYWNRHPDWNELWTRFTQQATEGCQQAPKQSKQDDRCHLHFLSFTASHTTGAICASTDVRRDML